MTKLISNNELIVCAMVGLMKRRKFGSIRLSAEPKVLVNYSEYECGFARVSSVRLKGDRNDLYVSFTDCMSGDYMEEELTASKIDPKFYDVILDAIYKTITNTDARILSYVDTTDNTKNPICVCTIDANLRLVNEEEVIGEMVDNIFDMTREDAEGVIKEIDRDSDGVGRFEDYEFFYEDCAMC